MTPEDMFITCLLIAVWCIMFYIGNKHEHIFYAFTLVLAIMMVEYLGWISLLFIGVSSYFVINYMIENFM